MTTVAPEKSVPTAVNCCVPLMAINAGFGEMLIAESVPGSLTPCTSHDAVNNPAIVTAAMTVVIDPRRASA